MNLPVDILKQYWGYEKFRPMQLDIVRSILNGTDTLALLPTGGGKSICFQVPGMCMEGICVVVSPLLALMEDQVQNLKRRSIKAVSVTSSQSPREIDRLLDNCVYGDVKFLYVSPERLHNELFLERFKKMKVNMIAVDESHCISQWGYDFRPAYLRIAEIRQWKPDVPVLALTASATVQVVQDIQDKLLFKNQNVLGTSFARENLSYIVMHEEDKEGKLIEICEKMMGSGIIYCGTRMRTKEVAEILKSRGIQASFYHAGMSVSDREFSYRKWLNNECRIICATNAFGMGIDKPDVRFVLHADMPAQPEAYFQEAGRGGRDGKKALAILLHNESDLVNLDKKVNQKFPAKQRVKLIYKLLSNHLQIAVGAGLDVAYSINIESFAKKYSCSVIEVYPAIQLLQLAGYIVLNDLGQRISKVIFTVNKHELYSYQVANQGMDMFIKLMLRMYGGLFEQYVAIREDDMARNAKLAVNQVVDKLKLLESHNVIHYDQRSDEEKITFLTGRMDEQSINLNKEVYELRKKADVDRVNVMKKYVTTHRCRSLQLLKYFGEMNVKDCGHCDVCRDNLRRGLTPQEIEKMNDAIIELTLAEPLSIEQLPIKLSQFDREHLLNFVRWKIDQGELIFDDRMRLVLPGMEA